jgi:multiple RNA-binding domain-containing protein 1
MDGKTFQGRLLHVLPAVDRKPKPEGDGKAKSVKESRQEKRKEFASKEFSWGMLYMNVSA